MFAAGGLERRATSVCVLREHLHEVEIGFVMALKRSHRWWHCLGEPGSLREIGEQPKRG